MRDRGPWRRFQGVLLQPLAKQNDVKPPGIDPNGVRFDPEQDYPVTLDFNQARRIGTARVSRHESGALMVEGEFEDGWPPVHSYKRGWNQLKAAVAVTVEGIEGEVVNRSLLNVVGLVWQHADLSQPPISIVREDIH